MKKTTYILIILVALTFISQIAIAAYLWSNRIPYEEYRARHPEWFSDDITESDDYYIESDDFYISIDDDEEMPATDVARSDDATVIDAAGGGFSVTVISDSPASESVAEDFYTDTLIITSPQKNIHVTTKIRE